MVHKFVVTVTLFGVLMSCQVPTLEGLGEVAPVPEAERVRPLDPIPEDALERIGSLDPPGPAEARDPAFPPKNQEAGSRPRLARLLAQPEVARGGEDVLLVAELAGDWRSLGPNLEAFVNLNHLVFPIVVPMRDDGLEGDVQAGDGRFTYRLRVPEDAVSRHWKLYAAAGANGVSLGTAGAYLTVVGGDFQVRQGFEGEDCPLDQPFVFPEDPEQAGKTRALHLIGGPWTVKDAWVNEEVALAGQFSLQLAHRGVLLSRWLANGRRLTYRTRESPGVVIRLSWSRDGKSWTDLESRRAATEKGDWTYTVDLPDGFHGYLRWILQAGDRAWLDQIRVWKRTGPAIAEGARE